MAKAKKGVTPAALKAHLFTKKSGAKTSGSAKPSFLMKSSKSTKSTKGTKGTKKSGGKR
jgi:hypothetical protein